MLFARRLLVTLCALLVLAPPVASQSIQTTSGFMAYPARRYDVSNFQSSAIDASGEKFACIVLAPKSGTLDKFEVRLASASNPQALRFSFQDVDPTNGNPDGTQDQYRDVAAGSVTAGAWVVPGLLTSDGTDSGTKRTVTRGDRLAMVIEFVSTVGNVSISNTDILASGDHYYADLFTTAWTKVSNATCNVALKYDDGTYAHIVPEMTAWTTAPSSATAFNSSSSPDEIGIKFRLPFTARVGGAWYAVDADNVFDVVLYDSDGSSVLLSASADPVYKQSPNAAHHSIRFSSEVTLSANTFYRLVIKPTSTSNVGIVIGTVSSAAIMDSLQGGQDIHRTGRADGGAWTDTTTQRPFMGLLLTGVGDNACASGGGGGCVVR